VSGFVATWEPKWLVEPWPEEASRDQGLQRMILAATGEGAAWRSVSAALRDAMVAWAAVRSPYYRRYLDPRLPFDCIPILTKSAIREHGDSLGVPNLPVEHQVHKATSGTTADPVAFRRDLASGYADLSARSFLLHLHSIPPDATWVWVAAPRRERPEQPGVRFLLTSELTRERIASEVEIWRQLPSYVVYGYASAIETMADEIVRLGGPLGRSPTCVVTTADLLTASGKARIEGAFGCPVHSWYGSNELGGYLAGTVPGTDRYLFNPFIAWIEVLDDEGRPAAPGEVGRLVATHLGNYGFPLVRYDTGDRAALAPVQDVGGFFVAERLEGRSSERIALPSGRVLTAVSLGNRLIVDPGFERLLLGYQCARVGDNAIEVRLRWREHPSAEQRRRLAESLRVHLDPETIVTFRDVEQLETSPSGKRWVVRDERDSCSGR